MDPINTALDFLLKHEAGISQTVLATVGFSRVIAALTPTKRDDKILARPEMWWRKAVDLITGAVHQPLVEASGDIPESPRPATPGPVIPEPPTILLDRPSPAVKASFLTVLSQLDQLGAQIVIKRK